MVFASPVACSDEYTNETKSQSLHEKSQFRSTATMEYGEDKQSTKGKKEKEDSA